MRYHLFVGRSFVAKWFTREHPEAEQYFAPMNTTGILSVYYELKPADFNQMTPSERDLLLQLFNQSIALTPHQVSLIKSLPIFETEPETNPDKLLNLCFKVVLDNDLAGELYSIPSMGAQLNKWRAKNYVTLNKKNVEWNFLDRDVPVTKLNSQFLKYFPQYSQLYSVCIYCNSNTNIS
jgi:hypothetical protein